MFDIKKLMDNKWFKVILGCTAGLIALIALIAAATPKEMTINNNINNYINKGKDCKIARKISVKKG